MRGDFQRQPLIGRPNYVSSSGEDRQPQEGSSLTRLDRPPNVTSSVPRGRGARGYRGRGTSTRARGKYFRGSERGRGSGRSDYFASRLASQDDDIPRGPRSESAPKLGLTTPDMFSSPNRPDADQTRHSSPPFEGRVEPSSRPSLRERFHFKAADSSHEDHHSRRRWDSPPSTGSSSRYPPRRSISPERERYRPRRRFEWRDRSPERYRSRSRDRVSAFKIDNNKERPSIDWSRGSPHLEHRASSPPNSPRSPVYSPPSPGHSSPPQKLDSLTIKRENLSPQPQMSAGDDVKRGVVKVDMPLDCIKSPGCSIVEVTAARARWKFRERARLEKEGKKVSHIRIR